MEEETPEQEAPAREGVTQDPRSGKWRINDGPAMFDSKEDAEQAYQAYQNKVAEGGPEMDEMEDVPEESDEYDNNPTPPTPVKKQDIAKSKKKTPPKK